MAVIVPLLRVLFVFSNIFETFKTLKLPPPSSRNAGRPSIRAMSQRKRAMKGCMAIWLVWCCYAAYEKTMDGVIGIFIPFYNEIKALIILFFLLTRARGAEPVYLHIMRPMVKPYAGTLDSLVDLTETFGDLVVLIFAIPYHIVDSVYHRFVPRPKEEAKAKDEAAPATKPQRAANPQLSVEDEKQVPEKVQNGTARSRRRPLQEAQSRARTSHANGTAASNGGVKSSSQGASHEIWYPPPPAYDESPPNESAGVPISTHANQIRLAADMSIDEWRRYEAFPAAYPPTPLSTRVQVSTLDVPVQPPLEGISEEQSYYYSYVASESIEVEQEQDFQESLQSPRENPRSAGDLSDDQDSAMGASASEGEMDCDEEEEDDFNVTLRTPALKRTFNFSNSTAFSMDRESGMSTGLSTTDGGSPVRTRTNSGASTTLHGSDTSSVAGKKRPLSSTQESRPLRAPLIDRAPSSQSQRRGSIRLTMRPPAQISRTTTASSASGPENKEATDDAASLAAKKRRVGTKEENKRETAPSRRPTIRSSTDATAAVKDTVVRRTATVSTVPRNTQPRAPTIRTHRTQSSKTAAD